MGPGFSNKHEVKKGKGKALTRGRYVDSARRIAIGQGGVFGGFSTLFALLFFFSTKLTCAEKEATKPGSLLFS